MASMRSIGPAANATGPMRKIRSSEIDRFKAIEDTGSVASRGCSRANAIRAAGGCAFDLRQVVLEDEERLPLVAVGIVHPCFVLRGVAAVGLHLVARDQPRLGPARANGQ